MATYSRRTREDGNTKRSNGLNLNNKYSSFYASQLIDFSVSIDQGERQEVEPIGDLMTDEPPSAFVCVDSPDLSITATNTDIGMDISLYKKSLDLLCSNKNHFHEDDEKDDSDDDEVEMKPMTSLASNIPFTSCDINRIPMQKPKPSFSNDQKHVWTNTGFPKTSITPVLHQNTSLMNANLLTVYSSPCKDYSNDTLRNLGTENDTQQPLPEYVRVMMEKDSSLRRLVRTGSVTISQVKPEVVPSISEDKFTVDCENSNDLDIDFGEKDAFIPPANIDEWNEVQYPFAQKLLKLVHLSLSESMISRQNCSVNNKKRIESIKYFGYEERNVSRKSAASSNPPTFVTSYKRSDVMKAKCESNGLDLSLPSHLRHKKSAGSTKNDQSNRKNGKFMLKSDIRPMDKPKSKKVRSKKNHAANTDETVDDSFQFDPMKFLEISLREGKPTIPDDSHRRKYKCGFCEKKFCWSTDLRRHHLIHTGERPFKCPTCPANFTRKFLMQKHVKKVHEVHCATAAAPSIGIPVITDGVKIKTEPTTEASTIMEFKQGNPSKSKARKNKNHNVKADKIVRGNGDNMFGLKLIDELPALNPCSPARGMFHVPSMIDASDIQQSLLPQGSDDEFGFYMDEVNDAEFDDREAKLHVT